MRFWFKYLIAAALFAGVAVSDTTSFTIHIIGDSTVCNYKDSAYPQTGWGQIIGSFFDGSRVRINNVAIGGRSSKTFIEEGRLNGLDGVVQRGDFVFVQFGHNDRYFGKKEREVPIDSLDFWLQQYIDKAKAWGATPVLVSPMMMNTLPRNVFSSTLSTKGEYNVREHMEALAQKNQIPFVDLNLKSYNAHKSMNSAYVSRYLFKYFMPGEYESYPAGVSNDGTTHFQASGSLTHSQWIVEELEEELNANYLSAGTKSELAKLVSTLKPRYDLIVKANVSNSNGLITHNQKIPGDAPLILHVSPGSFGKKFQYWADDDCNVVSSDSNFFGKNTPARSITYTAMFDGGTACVKTPHGEESSSSVIEISSSSSAESSDSTLNELCFTGVADVAWPSPIEMSKPDIGEGSTDTNHDGYTGVGFFNIANSATSKATYNLTSDQSASNARVMIRYAFVGTSNRDMKFTIDNGVYAVAFPPTGEWNKWDTVYIDDVWVDALDFKLTIESTVASGGPNIDMIAFDIKDVYRTGCEPATVEEQSSSSLETESSGSGESSSSGSDDEPNTSESSSSVEAPESNGSIESSDSDEESSSSATSSDSVIENSSSSRDLESSSSVGDESSSSSEDVNLIYRYYERPMLKAKSKTVNLLGRSVHGKKAFGKYFEK